MTCKYNYKNISLKSKTYSDLQEISKELSPRELLSPAKTIDNLVYLYKHLLPTRKGNVNVKEDQSEKKD